MVQLVLAPPEGEGLRPTGMVYNHHILNPSSSLNIEGSQIMQRSLRMASYGAEDEAFTHVQPEELVRLYARIDASYCMFNSALCSELVGV